MKKKYEVRWSETVVQHYGLEIDIDTEETDELKLDDLIHQQVVAEYLEDTDKFYEYAQILDEEVLTEDRFSELEIEFRGDEWPIRPKLEVAEADVHNYFVDYLFPKSRIETKEDEEQFVKEYNFTISEIKRQENHSMVDFDRDIYDDVTQRHLELNRIAEESGYKIKTA